MGVANGSYGLSDCTSNCERFAYFCHADLLHFPTCGRCISIPNSIPNTSVQTRQTLNNPRENINEPWRELKEHQKTWLITETLRR